MNLSNPPHRFFLFASVAKETAANAAAAAWDPDSGGARTFGAVRLSASGAEPATHLGCATAATDAMRTAILQALTNVPFYHVYAAGDGWTWESALGDAGLAVIPPPAGG